MHRTPLQHLFSLNISSRSRANRGFAAWSYSKSGKLFSIAGPNNISRSKSTPARSYRFAHENSFVSSRCAAYSPYNDLAVYRRSSQCHTKDFDGVATILMPRSLHGGLNPEHRFRGLEI